MVNLALQLILQKRLEKKYSQLFLALHLEISQSQYARLENGTSALKLDMLCRILEVLDIDYDEFFYQVKQSELRQSVMYSQ